MTPRVIQLVYTQVALSLGEDPCHSSFEIVLTYLIVKKTQSQGNIMIFVSRVSQNVSEDEL